MIAFLASSTEANAGRIIVASGVLAGLVIVLSIGLWYYRRWWIRGTDSSPTWTLEDLRKMRDRGDLSEAEYQVLRSAMIGAYHQSAARPEGDASSADAVISNDSGADFDLKKCTPP